MVQRGYIEATPETRLVPTWEEMKAAVLRLADEKDANAVQDELRKLAARFAIKKE